MFPIFYRLIKFYSFFLFLKYENLNFKNKFFYLIIKKLIFFGFQIFYQKNNFFNKNMLIFKSSFFENEWGDNKM